MSRFSGLVACIGVALVLAGCSDGGESFVVGEGGRHGCGDLPLPAEQFRRYRKHDCWAFTQDKIGSTLYILGGHDTEDPAQGIIIVLDPNQTSYTSVLPTPEKRGDVTLYHATLEYACYTTAEEGFAPPHVIATYPFDARPPKFLSQDFVSGLCPPR